MRHFRTNHFMPLAAGTAMVLLASCLTGCGALQATGDGVVSAAKWTFTTQVKTMSFDILAREGLNQNAEGQSFSTVIRFYQLKDSKTFSQLTYVQLQNNDLEVLKADLLATNDLVLRPGATASVSEPMNEKAEYVGVVAFFHTPDSDATWKLLIPKKQWKDTDPVKLEAGDNTLTLFNGDAPRPVARRAPQQSSPADAKSTAPAN